jgi:hypothetical protein
MGATMRVACAGDATKVTAELYQMSPQAIAQLAGAGDGDWVAKTAYPAVALGGGVSAMVLFARPAPATANICAVDILQVSFATDQQGMPGETTPYRVAGTSRSRAFAIATDDCAHTTIHPDFMKREGADNVFTASSPEDASRGAKRFAAVLAAARDKQEPLPYAFACKDSNGACNSPRKMLTTLNATDFEEAGRCAGDDCLFVQGFDGHFDWRLEMSQAHVALSLVMAPVF